MLQRALYLAVHGEAFLSQPTIHVKQGHKSSKWDFSIEIYTCFYLRQQPKIWKSAESNIDSDKNARHFIRQRKIKKQGNTHPLLPLESPYLFPFFLPTHSTFFFLIGWRVLRRQYALPTPTKIADIPISHHLVYPMVSLVNGFMFSQVNTQHMIRYLCLYLLSLALVRLFTAQNAAEMS